MSNRTYPRQFDWDEAKEMYDRQVPMSWIAKKLNVSPAAVRRVVQPGAKEAQAEYAHRSSVGKGRCEECGAATNAYSAYHHDRAILCAACAAAKRRTNIRDNELKCTICHQWKPDHEFHNSSLAVDKKRRRRRQDCRECSNKARALYRETHKTPCLGGCGRKVSIADQRASKKYLHSKGLTNSVTLGYCPYCSPTGGQQPNLKESARRFREKYDTPIA